MESILVKIFATGLALSQVTTTPDQIKTEFDKDRDQAEVAELLHRGCNQMLKVFDLENINFDELLTIALDDPQAIGENKAFRGINFADLQIAYRQFCKKAAGGTLGRRPRRRDRRLQQGRCRPAGPHQAQGPETPGCERGARPQGQPLRGGLRGKPATRLGGACRHSAACAERLRGGGGQAVLPAQGHRRTRPDPRVHRQSGPVRTPAGRLDHHAAGGEKPPGRGRSQLRAENPRDDRRRTGGDDAHQERDSGTLSQLGLSRPQRLGNRAGGPELLRQIGERIDRSKKAPSSQA